MLIAQDKFYTYFLLIILLGLYIALPGWQAIITLMIWSVVVGYCLLHIKERMLLLFFQLTLFTFLMTRMVLPDIFSTTYIEQDEDGAIRMFSFETLRFIYTTLIISIIGSFVGFTIIPDVVGKHISHYDTDNQYITTIRRTSKIFYYITSFFYLILILEKSIFVFRYGYFELYTDFVSRMPGIVHKFASLYLPIFYLYLASFPVKKEARMPIILFIIMGVISLGTGSRTTFMLSAISILIYYLLRNILSPDAPWLTKKGVIATVIAIPIILIAMFVIAFIRIESDFDNASLFELFVNFFYQQGSSARVIGLTYDLQKTLDDGRTFTFGYMIDNFNKNIIFKILGIAKEYKSQTPEMAMYGHSLANTITYIDNPDGFLGGYGYGSSYIAEVWHDFGYVGLFLWNIMYGVIFSKFYYWIQKGIWPTTFCLIMIPNIIYAPRGQASAFLYFFISITILLSFYFIHLIGKNYAKA